MRRVAHILSTAMAGPPPAVWRGFSYELTTANQSGAGNARISRYRTNFDTARNRYIAVGQGYTSAYPTYWVKLDVNNNLIWTRYVTGGQTVDRPWSITGVFPDSTAAYYYIVGVSPVNNAQGFGKVMVSKFDMTSHAVVWHKRLDTICCTSGTTGLRGPYAAYDSSDDSLYIACMNQNPSGAATAYFSLTKVLGSDGSVAVSKTSYNGSGANQGNNTPWTPIHLYGNYVYLVTYSATNVCVAKFNKSDFSRVWCKIASTLSMTTGTSNTVAFDVDSAGSVYVAATLSTTQTVVYKFLADGSRADYVTFSTPSYAPTGMIAAQCYLMPHSICVDNNSNVYISYGYHVAGNTTATTTAIIGCFSFTGSSWKWIRAVDVIREDTGASIGVSDGWAMSINGDRVYFSGACDVTAAGISNVDNNAQWQTLNFSIDLLGRRLTDNYNIGTFSANRRSIKVANITPGTITKTTYTPGNSTLFATMVDTAAVATTVTWNVSATTTDFVNKYN